MRACIVLTSDRFAVCMNTGLLGILLHQFPYKFRGSGVLSTIFWVADITLFLTFTLVQIVRHIFFRKAAIRQTLSSMDEMCFWGTWPIAMVTVVAQVGLTGSTATSWGPSAQHGFAVFAIALWWINVFVMLAVAFTMYYLIAKRRMVSKTQIPSAIFLPAVGTTTVGLVGAIICVYAEKLSSRLAVPVIVTSYLLEGFGWWIACIIFPIFLHDLWSQGFGPPAKMPALMMLVGPSGQVGAALNVLGTAAVKHFGSYDKGTFLTASSAEAVQGASTVLALLLLGFDIFWLIFLLYALLEAGFKRQLKLGMPWWSTIFPVGTVNTTFLVLGVELDSPTFRTLATSLYLILLIDYLLCWVMTGYLVWKGQLLDGRQQLEKKR